VGGEIGVDPFSLKNRSVQSPSTYLSRKRHTRIVRSSQYIRTSVDIPRPLHRDLREAAARRGSSVRRLILLGIQIVFAEAEPRRPKRRLSLDRPIVPSTGKPFDLTSSQIYQLINLP